VPSVRRGPFAADTAMEDPTDSAATGAVADSVRVIVELLAGRSVDPSGAHLKNEHFLLGGLHCLRAVVVPDPPNGIVRRMPAQHCEACEGRPSATVASQAAQFHLSAGTCPVVQIFERRHYVSQGFRDPEVWPLDVFMGPRWLPCLVEI
jgi:hypothetical protein